LKGQNSNRKVTLFRYVNGKKVSFPFLDERFYLRGSVEYTNPQLTVEEVQGIIGTRLLETCANYFYEHGLHQPDDGRSCYAGRVTQETHARLHCAFSA
jgi:hypothetical protein